MQICQNFASLQRISRQKRDGVGGTHYGARSPRLSPRSQALSTLLSFKLKSLSTATNRSLSNPLPSLLRQPHTRATHLLTYDADPILLHGDKQIPHKPSSISSPMKSPQSLSSPSGSISSHRYQKILNPPLFSGNQFPHRISLPSSPLEVSNLPLSSLTDAISASSITFFLPTIPLYRSHKNKVRRGIPRLTLSVVVTDSNKRSASLPVRRQGTPRGL